MNRVLFGIVFALVVVLLVTSILFWFIVAMPGQSLSGSLPALSIGQEKIAKRLRRHVTVLAGTIGERHAGVADAYAAAADYIQQELTLAGLAPYVETFGDKQQFLNIVAEHYGTDESDEIIVIGAHYDTVWMSPGADDNASGVAVMLELARQLANVSFRRQLRFVAFANEESTYFSSEDMGSLFHARQAYERGEMIRAMFSLEMLGYYSDEPDSQYYPGLFRWFYPDRADFIAFVSNFLSRPLLTKSIGAFRQSGQFRSEGFAAPAALVPDVRRSDHASFWRYGYPAVMVTDTASYRNLAYHNISDMPGTLDYENMARVTSGLIAVITELANPD